MKRHLAEGILWAVSAILMIACVVVNITNQHYVLAVWCAVNGVVSIADSYFGFKHYFRTKSK